MFEMAKQQETYLLQLLQNMQNTIDKVDAEQDNQAKLLNKVHEQTKKTNGKVIKLREDVDLLQTGSQVGRQRGTIKMPAISDKFLQLIALGAVILLVIVAASLSVDLKGILP